MLAAKDDMQPSLRTAEADHGSVWVVAVEKHFLCCCRLFEVSLTAHTAMMYMYALSVYTQAAPS